MALLISLFSFTFIRTPHLRCQPKRKEKSENSFIYYLNWVTMNYVCFIRKDRAWKWEKGKPTWMANAVVCRFPNVPSSNCSLLIACIGSVMCRLRKSLVFRLRIHSRAINAVALVSTKHYKCSVACSKRGILRVCREVEKSMLIIEVKVKKTWWWRRQWWWELLFLFPHNKMKNVSRKKEHANSRKPK